MSKNKELAKNTLTILIGKFTTQFLSFFLLPLYTIYLSTDQYGTFDLISTYIALLVPILSLELSNSIFRFLLDFRNNDKKKSEIFINILIAITLLSVLTIFISLIINIFFPIKYLFYILFNIVSLMLSSVALQTARGIGKNNCYALGSIICAISTIILNILFIGAFKMGIEGILLATSFANILCFIYIMNKIKILNDINLKLINKKTLTDMIKYSVPLIPNGISWWVVNASDRTIISLLIGVSANGIYSIANKFSTMFIGLYSVFNLSWTESTSLHINDEDKEQFFSETINTMFMLFASISLLIIVLVPFILPFLINTSYAHAYYYIPLLLIGSLFNVIVGLVSVVYVAKKLSKEIAKTSVLSAALNIILNLILVRYFGVYGACISTIIAFMVLAIYRYIDVQKYVKIKLDFNTLIVFSLMITAVIFIYYQNNIITNILNLVFVFIYSLIVNKKILHSLIIIIKEKIKR